MIPIIRRRLDAIPRNKPLSCRRIIPRVRLRLFDVIAIPGGPDVVGIDWMAISIAAALEMKNRVRLAAIPVVRVSIAR
jgi:hypothetical protein